MSFWDQNFKFPFRLTNLGRSSLFAVFIVLLVVLAYFSSSCVQIVRFVVFDVDLVSQRKAQRITWPTYRQLDLT